MSVDDPNVQTDLLIRGGIPQCLYETRILQNYIYPQGGSETNSASGFTWHSPHPAVKLASDLLNQTCNHSRSVKTNK